MTDKSKEAIERLNLVQETVYCIRNTFNQNTESDKLVRNCMALLQNAIDGEYHDMEEVDVSELKRPTGHWVNGYKSFNCSVCGKIAYSWNHCGEYIQVKSNFCPNCGADMRMEKND